MSRFRLAAPRLSLKTFIGIAAKQIDIADFGGHLQSALANELSHSAGGQSKLFGKLVGCNILAEDFHTEILHSTMDKCKRRCYDT